MEIPVLNFVPCSRSFDAEFLHTEQIQIEHYGLQLKLT